MNFITKTYSELTTYELYKILRLRAEVFIVEQNCVFQDIDGKDYKALHVYGIKNDRIVAYARIFNRGDYFKNASIGRVVVAKNERGYGYGYEAVEASIKAIKTYFNADKITISAQVYLQKFYETHGFVKVGEAYLEDGIPHIKMDKI